MKKSNKIIYAIVTAATALALFACGTPAAEIHTHSYSDGWEFDSDKHWHECECGGKSGAADHTPSDWIVDKAATHTAAGSRHKECETCGYYIVSEAIDKLGEHTFSKEVASESFLYIEQPDYSKLYYYSCECGVSEGNAGHTFKVNHSHTYDRNVAEELYYADEATTDHGTLYYKSCVCGAFEQNDANTFESGPRHVHTYDTAVWHTSETHHWHNASCGHNARSDYGPHASVGSYKVGTEELAGKHYKTCVCGAVTESAPHSFTEHNNDFSYYVGTEGDNDIYKLSCVCGAASEDPADVFEVASHVHDTDIVGSDDDNHWRECSVCGKVDASSVAAHDYGTPEVWTTETEASYDGPGEERCSCRYSGCGHYKTKTTAQLFDKGFTTGSPAIFEAFTEPGNKVYCKEDSEGVRITIAKTTDTDWHIKFQTHTKVDNGSTYEITYTFISSAAREVGLEIGGSDATGITGAGAYNVSAGTNSLTAHFTATSGEVYNNIKIGKLHVGDYIIVTGVTIKKSVSGTYKTVHHYVPDPELTHSHTYSITDSDEDQHWKECRCGEKMPLSTIDHIVLSWSDAGNGTHTGTCTSCNRTVSKAHTGGTFADEGGMHKKHCAKCNAVYESHDYDVESYASDNATTHSGACSCGLTVTAAHTECTDWKVGSDALAGSHYKDCTVCGHVTASDTHTFADNIDSKYYVSDNGVIATYYKSCSTCGAASTDTFTVAIHEHEYTVANHDGDNHWNECSICHQVDESSVAAHTYDNGEWTTVQPTYDAEGSRTHKCDSCDYVCEETIPVKTDAGFTSHGVVIHKENTYEVTTADTANGYEVELTKAPESKTNWHLKVVRELTDMTVNGVYELTYTFTSNVAGTSLIKLEVASGSIIVFGDNMRDVSDTEDNVFTVRFVAKAATIYADLQLGMLSVGNKITIKDITLKKVTLDADPITSYTAEDPMDGWANEGHASTNMTYTVNNGAITATTASGWTKHADTYGLRVCFGTDVTVTEGKNYIVSVKVKSCTGADAEILFRKGAGWTSDYTSVSTGVTGETELTAQFYADSTKTVSVWLQIGHFNASETIEIESITIYELGGASASDSYDTLFHITAAA